MKMKVIDAFQIRYEIFLLAMISKVSSKLNSLNVSFIILLLQLLLFSFFFLLWGLSSVASSVNLLGICSLH